MADLRIVELQMPWRREVPRSVGPPDPRRPAPPSRGRRPSPKPRTQNAPRERERLFENPATIARTGEVALSKPLARAGARLLDLDLTIPCLRMSRLRGEKLSCRLRAFRDRAVECFG